MVSASPGRPRLSTRSLDPRKIDHLGRPRASRYRRDRNRLWPPARYLAWRPLANSAAASSMLEAAMIGGLGHGLPFVFLFPPFSVSPPLVLFFFFFFFFFFFPPPPPPLNRESRARRGRAIAGISSLLEPMAAGNGVDDRRGGADRAGLAAALNAEWIARTQRRGVLHLERWQVLGARHGVVHVLGCHATGRFCHRLQFSRGAPDRCPGQVRHGPGPRRSSD